MGKIILIWTICVVVISIFLGEIVNQKTKNKQSMSITENKSINNSFNFEKNDFFSIFSLRLRGSWRVANGYIMEHSKFQELKEIEYNKNL